MMTTFLGLELENDEEIELELLGELVEMVRASSVIDADALLDMLIDGLSDKVGKARPSEPSKLFLGPGAGSAVPAVEGDKKEGAPHPGKSGLWDALGTPLSTRRLNFRVCPLDAFPGKAHSSFSLGATL